MNFWGLVKKMEAKELFSILKDYMYQVLKENDLDEENIIIKAKSQTFTSALILGLKRLCFTEEIS